MVRESALHDGVTVAEGAVVVRSVVGADAHVDTGCRVESTIVGVGAAAVAGAITAVVLTTDDEGDAGGSVGNLDIQLDRVGD